MGDREVKHNGISKKKAGQVYVARSGEGPTWAPVPETLFSLRGEAVSTAHVRELVRNSVAPGHNTMAMFARQCMIPFAVKGERAFRHGERAIFMVDVHA